MMYDRFVNPDLIAGYVVLSGEWAIGRGRTIESAIADAKEHCFAMRDDRLTQLEIYACTLGVLMLEHRGDKSFRPLCPHSKLEFVCDGDREALAVASEVPS